MKRRWRVFFRDVDAAFRVLVAGLVVAAGMPQTRGATLLTWDITGTTGSTGSGAASPLATGVSGSAMSSGAGLSLGNSTSPSNTWNRTYSTLYTSATASMAGNQFIQWTTTAAAGYTVSFNGLSGMFLARTSTAGPNQAELWYSTDGTTFLQTGSAFGVSTLASAATAFSSTMASTPIVLDGGLSGATLTWRLVGYNATGRMGIGNAGTDNFSMLGTITGGTARDLTWVGSGGSGTWDTDPANLAWTTGSSAAAFANNDNVTFNSAGMVAVAAGVSAGTVAVGNASGVLTLGGGFAGTTFAKTGAGEVVLGGSNAISGGVNAAAGTVTVGAVGALGSAAATFSGATLRFADPAGITVANAFGTGTAGASVNVAAGVSGTMSGAISALGTLSGSGVLRGDPATFSTLTKTGSGTLTLAGNVGSQMSYDTTNKYVSTSGGINLQVQEGTVELTGGKTWNLATGTAVATGSSTFNGMQWDGNVRMNGGTIQINGGNVRGSGTIQVAGTAANTLAQRLNFNSPDIANTVSVADGSTLTLSAAANGSIKLVGAVFGGTGATITNAGSGVASISGTLPSSFAGTFVAAAGAGGFTLTSQAMAAAAAAVTNGTLRIDNAASGAAVATPISGTGSVSVIGSQKVTLSGSSTYSGGTLLTADVGLTKLWDGVSGSLGSGTIRSGNADARIYWDGPEASVSFSQLVSTGTSATYRLGFAGTGKTFVLTGTAPGSISGNGVIRASSGAVVDLTQQTASTNSNTGGVEIGNATLLASSDDNLGAGALVFSGTASVFQARAANTAISRAVAVGVTGGLSGIAAQFDTNGNTMTLSAAIADRAGTPGGGLTKLGAGTLTLLGTNTYTGPTIVSAGTLVLGTNAAIETSSGITVATGATLATGSGSQNLRGLSGPGTVATGSGGILGVGFGDASSTFAGRITGAGSLLKTGSGTVALSGSNTLTGPTTVSQGTLQLATASALSSSAVTVAAGATLSVSPQVAAVVPALVNNGLVDVGLGGLTVTSGQTAAGIVAAIIAGRTDGTWSGTSGITSSAAATQSERAVGWLDNGDGSFTVAFGAAGDWNLNGVVDFDDVVQFVSANLYDTGLPATWAEGDFDYNGVVDFDDVVASVSANLFDAGPYNTAPGGMSALGFADGLVGGGVVAVPEPATWVLVTLGVAYVVASRQQDRRIRLVERQRTLS